MKCVCGYEYEVTIETTTEEDEDNGFLFAGFNALVIVNEKNLIKKVYVCPKCGTLKINIGE